MEGSTCEIIWGGNDCGFSSKATEGRLRGMLHLWSTKIFKKFNEIQGEHFIGVKWYWGWTVRR